MNDPRERIETRLLGCQRMPWAPAGEAEWVIGAVQSGHSGRADWPEVVAFARAILAADEAWLDSQTPTLEELRAKYPAWCPSLAREFWGVRGVLDVVDCSGDSGCRFTVGPWGTERDALRWLAAKLEELT